MARTVCPKMGEREPPGAAYLLEYPEPDQFAHPGRFLFQHANDGVNSFIEILQRRQYKRRREVRVWLKGTLLKIGPCPNRACIEIHDCGEACPHRELGRRRLPAGQLS